MTTTSPEPIGPLDRLGRGEYPGQHLVGGPRHLGHCGDPHPLVHLGPPGVVDEGGHPRDLVVLLGDASRDNVGVVASGHRQRRSRHPRYPLLRGSPGRSPTPVSFLPPKAGEQALLECVGVLVDDRHGEAAALQTMGKLRPHPTATNDYRMHGIKIHERGWAGEIATFRGPRELTLPGWSVAICF